MQPYGPAPQPAGQHRTSSDCAAVQSSPRPVAAGAASTAPSRHSISESSVDSGPLQPRAQRDKHCIDPPASQSLRVQLARAVSEHQRCCPVLHVCPSTTRSETRHRHGPPRLANRASAATPSIRAGAGWCQHGDQLVPARLVPARRSDAREPTPALPAEVHSLDR